MVGNGTQIQMEFFYWKMHNTAVVRQHNKSHPTKPDQQ